MAEPKTTYSEPEYVQNQDKSQVPFWRPTIADRTPPEASTHDLLTTYSHIPHADHAAHIHHTRDRLWAIRQYPCTGAGGWLTPQIRLSAVYPEVLARVAAGATAVDLGTFIGHDLRRLVVDGGGDGAGAAGSENLWGVDIVNHFDVGFDFFNDRARWRGRFVEADFLTVETNPVLGPLRGRADVVFLASVLHQWDWEGQVRGAVAVAGFTKPGALVVGLQMGRAVAGAVVMQGLKVPLYIHTPESFARLWDEVGAATGTKWETNAFPRSWEWIGVDSGEMSWMGPGVQLLEFNVRRVL